MALLRSSLGRLRDLLADGDLSVVDSQMEAARRIRANPRLVTDRRSFPPVVAQRDQEPAVAGLTGWERGAVNSWHLRSTPSLGSAAPQIRPKPSDPGPPQHVDLPMSRSNRLREPVPGRRFENHASGAPMIDPVSRRHEDRFHPVSGSQNAPDNLPSIPEGRPIALPDARVSGGSHEARFRTPHGRDPPDDAEMARETEPTRMRDPLPVENHEIRASLELLVRLLEDGPLPEGKIPGNVREIRLAHRRRHLDRLESGPAEDDHRGEELPVRPLEGDITAGDPANPTSKRLDSNPPPESLLEGSPFGKGPGPPASRRPGPGQDNLPEGLCSTETLQAMRFEAQRTDGVEDLRRTVKRRKRTHREGRKGVPNRNS